MSTKLLSLLNGKRPLGVYTMSWSTNWASDPSKCSLSQVPSPVNIVYISFVKPDCTYIKGSNSFAGSGLDYSSDFAVIKGAIEILKKRGVIVMLSTGGATYSWKTYNPKSISALASDLGVHGVDIDWEDSLGNASSGKLGPIISAFRNEMPNLAISMAGFSVGTYGEGKYINSQPPSQNTGMCIPALKSNGHQLDWINIMSYDAGTAFSVTESYDAYRSYFKGPLLIGYENYTQAWGGAIQTLNDVKNYCQYILSKNSNSMDGLFAWSLEKPGPTTTIQAIMTASEILQKNVKPSPVKPNIVPPKPSPITPIITPVKPIVPPFVPPKPEANITLWVVGRIYNTGDKVLYKDGVYRCIQGHIAQSDWSPSVYTQALWFKL